MLSSNVNFSVQFGVINTSAESYSPPVRRCSEARQQRKAPRKPTA